MKLAHVIQTRVLVGVHDLRMRLYICDVMSDIHVHDFYSFLVSCFRVHNFLNGSDIVNSLFSRIDPPTLVDLWHARDRKEAFGYMQNTHGAFSLGHENRCVPLRSRSQAWIEIDCVLNNFMQMYHRRYSI